MYDIIIYYLIYIFVICLLWLWFIGLFNIDSINGCSLFPGFVFVKRYIKFDVTNNNIFRYFKNVTKFMRENKYSGIDNYKYSDLPYDIKHIFHYIDTKKVIQDNLECLFHKPEYTIKCMVEMNEICNIKCDPTNVQVENRVDGIFGFFPYISVFKCVINISDNIDIFAHFPMSCNKHVIDKNSVICFDYNREVYCITNRCDNGILMILYYCVYPYGWDWLFVPVCNVHKLYDYIIKRYTISIKKYECIGILIESTNISSLIELYIGYKNIYYVLICEYSINNIIPLRDVTYVILPIGLKMYMLTYTFINGGNLLRNLEVFSNIRDIVLFSIIYLIFTTIF